MEVHAVEAGVDRTPRGRGERVECLLDLLLGRFSDLPARQLVRDGGRREWIERGHARLAPGMSDLGEDAAAVAVHGRGQTPQTGHEAIRVDPCLAFRVLAARVAEEMPGDDQPHVVARERLVERDERVGDLSVGAGHRLRGARTDEAVPRLDRADPAGLERSAAHARSVRRAASRTISGWRGISFS